MDTTECEWSDCEDKNLPNFGAGDNADNSKWLEDMDEDDSLGLEGEIFGRRKKKGDGDITDLNSTGTGSEFCSSSDTLWLNGGLWLLGLGLSWGILMHRKLGWIMREWFYQEGEGRLVSKFVVILLFLFLYSFVLWGLEVIAMIDTVFNIWFPNKYLKVQKYLEDFRNKAPAFMWLRDRKSMVVINAPLCTMVGIMIWDLVWLIFVCKSHHDRSCTNTWIGEALFNYRNDVCQDGKTSSAVCEKIIAYIPMMVITIGSTIMGNVVTPFINDCLSDTLNCLTGPGMNKEMWRNRSQTPEKRPLSPIREASESESEPTPTPEKKMCENQNEDAIVAGLTGSKGGFRCSTPNSDLVRESWLQKNDISYGLNTGFLGTANDSTILEQSNDNSKMNLGFLNGTDDSTINEPSNDSGNESQTNWNDTIIEPPE